MGFFTVMGLRKRIQEAAGRGRLSFSTSGSEQMDMVGISSRR